MMRRSLLFAALAVALAAAWFAPEPATSPASAIVAAQPRRPQPPVVASLAAAQRDTRSTPLMGGEDPTLELVARVFARPGADPFAIRSASTVKPTAVPAPAPTVSPAADTANATHAANEASQPVATAPPPFPYRFAGRIDDDAGTRVFMTRGEHNLVIRAGELIEGLYRIESIETGRLVVEHLASGQRQEISIAPTAR